MVCSQEMHNLGYAWKSIKEQLGEEFESHIHRMSFLKGKMVCKHTHMYIWECCWGLYTSPIHLLHFQILKIKFPIRMYLIIEAIVELDRVRLYFYYLTVNIRV